MTAICYYYFPVQTSGVSPFEDSEIALSRRFEIEWQSHRK